MKKKKKKSELKKFYHTKILLRFARKRIKMSKGENVWVGFHAIGTNLMWTNEYRTHRGNIIKTERLYDPFSTLFSKVSTFARIFEQRDSSLARNLCLLVPFHLFARPISPTIYPFDFRFYISRGRKSGYYFSAFTFKKREISRNRFAIAFLCPNQHQQQSRKERET